MEEWVTEWVSIGSKVGVGVVCMFIAWKFWNRLTEQADAHAKFITVLQKEHKKELIDQAEKCRGEILELVTRNMDEHRETKQVMINALIESSQALNTVGKTMRPPFPKTGAKKRN